MDTFTRDDMLLVVDTGDVQIRARELGDMTVTFYSFKKGADLREALRGLPGDACSCPHWSLVLKGRLRVHTRDGASDVAAGDGFFVEPGHWPEALEDTEMFELSPTSELRAVGEHLIQRLGLQPLPSDAQHASH